MAEDFMCHGEFIYFSNGGGHDMIKEWSEIASNHGFLELSQLLKYQTQLGNGCCAIGIDEEFLPEGFTEIERKKEWTKVMDVFLTRLRDGSAFDGLVKLQFDEALIRSWVERCEILRSALDSQIDWFV